MVIETTTPEIEVLIQQRLQAGGFKDAEDVLLQALRSFPADPPSSERIKAIQSMSFSELFAPLRGLNIDFEQDRQRVETSSYERVSGRHKRRVGTDPRPT